MRSQWYWGSGVTALHAKQSSSSHKYGPGVKHVNTAIACQTLEVVYLATNKPADTGLAVSLLIQPDKIQRRVSDDDKDLALSMSQSLRAAQVAQARFEEGSVLSAVPWCWAPTSRHDDNKDGATVCWAADAQWQERQPKHVRPRRCSKACASLAFQTSWPRLAMR